MKLEHFGMAEPGDCRLVFTAGAEELAAAVAQVQAEPDAPPKPPEIAKKATTFLHMGSGEFLMESIFKPVDLSWEV